MHKPKLFTRIKMKLGLEHFVKPVEYLRYKAKDMSPDEIAEIQEEIEEVFERHSV